MYVLELYDLLTVTCTEVGLTAYTGSVAGITYSFDSSGLRTSISLASKPFVLSDIIGKHETITTNTEITNVSGTAWSYGAGVPNNANGSDGDFYMDTTNNNFYKKIAGAWVLIDSYGGGGGAGVAGYIPRGTITEVGDGTTTAAYVTIASRVVTNAKDWILAKVVVTCQFDTYIRFLWDGGQVGEERLFSQGAIEHFPYGAFGTMAGDGAKEFEVQAKQYTTPGLVYVEIQGEEA
jgi:hypothetical protein